MRFSAKRDDWRQADPAAYWRRRFFPLAGGIAVVLADPQFGVYAVSIASAACLMAFGPGSVRVIVTQHGQVVWDSAACKQTAAAPVWFQTGVPQFLTISWSRTATSPAGCAGSLPAGASGTFQAVAMTAGQDSSVRTFTLAR